MRKQKVFLFFFIFLVVSCVPRAKYNDVLLQRDSLTVANDENTRQMQMVQSYIEEISNSLDSIAIQESILFIPNPETNDRPLSYKEKIERLENFQQLVERQHNKINELEQAISADSLEMSKMHSIITFLSKQIEEKDQSIMRLKTELQNSQHQVRRLSGEIDNLNSHISSLNNNIETLETISQSQSQALTVQDMLLHEAFVYLGSRKELMQIGVRFGIKADYTAVKKDQANSIDVREFRSICINSTRVKLLTPMPIESYTLTVSGNQTILDIIDPGMFWSNSSVLIIQTDAIISTKHK